MNEIDMGYPQDWQSLPTDTLEPNRYGNTPAVPQPKSRMGNGSGNWEGPGQEPVAALTGPKVETFAQIAPDLTENSAVYPWEDSPPLWAINRLRGD
jgi:hypothetical protein